MTYKKVRAKTPLEIITKFGAPRTMCRHLPSVPLADFFDNIRQKLPFEALLESCRSPDVLSPPLADLLDVLPLALQGTLHDVATLTLRGRRGIRCIQCPD